MQPLVDRAAAVMDRLGNAAVPLAELVRLLREGGIAVSEPVLQRSLAAEPERFRLLEPWRALRAAGKLLKSPWGETAWVIPARAVGERDVGPPRPAALGRLQSTLIALAWELDPSSSTDVARWFGMVLEAERLRAVLPVSAAPPAASLSSSGGAAASATPRPRPGPPASAPALSRPGSAGPAPAPARR
jgi:hypothetical protein